MSFFGKKSNKIELPKDFADQILQNDIRLTMSKFTDSIALQNLIQLYMKGVEYYELQRDIVSEYYKSKLNWLMNHPLISSPKKKDDSPHRKVEFKVTTLHEIVPFYDNIEPIQEQLNETIECEIVQNTTLRNQTNEVKQIIDNLKKETFKMNEVISQLDQIIQNDLNSQKSKIADRIHKRNKSYIDKRKTEDDVKDEEGF